MLLPENVRNDRQVAMAYTRSRRGAQRSQRRLEVAWGDREFRVERAR